MRKEIAGVVVYRPDYERLSKNIEALVQQVDVIILYCNSKIDLKKLPDINYLVMNNDNDKNDGIAHALNEIMKTAERMKTEWCLLLDQDSVIPCNLIKTYRSLIENDKFKISDVAVITPQITDKSEHKMVQLSDTVEKVKECITSASYNNIAIWNKLGRFREDFFIDYVDWEYCARARKNGYIILRMNNVVLDHQLGKLTYHHFFNKEFSTYNHSAFRKFYITRNSFIINYLYPNVLEFQHPYLRILKRMFIVVAFEKKKASKIKSMVKGYLEYIKWKNREEQNE